MEQIVICLFLLGVTLLFFYVVVEYRIGVSSSRIVWQMSLASIVQVLWTMPYKIGRAPVVVLAVLVLLITIFIMAKKSLKLKYWFISNLLITPSISFFHYKKWASEPSSMAFMGSPLGKGIEPLILTVLYFIIQLTLWIVIKFIKWVKFSN